MQRLARLRSTFGILLAVVLVATLIPLAGPAGAIGTFNDDDGNIHESAIEKIAALGITLGCNPPANDRFCPDDHVTRQQMASFLVRTFDLPPGPSGQFVDTSGSVHQSDIEALAASGITKGCNPPANDRFCPNDRVTRGQMAAFMARGLQLDLAADDFFADDNDNIFEAEINAIARVGITRGCNPPQNTEYCPDNPVRRDEMASFLSRVADIVSTGTTVTVPPPSTTTPPPTTPPTTTPPAACNAHQLVTLPCRFDWDVDEGGTVADKDGTRTGFTKVLPKSSGGNPHIPQNIDVVTSGPGRMSLTTTPGIFGGSGNPNNQDNALGVQIVAADALVTATTSVLSPPTGTGQSQQAGIWLATNDDNYVKLVVLSEGGTANPRTVVELATEREGSLTVNGKSGAIQPGASSVQLRMVINSQDLTVTGEYRLGSSGGWTSVGTADDLPNQVFGFDPAGNAAYVGLFATHRNGPSPLTYDFDFFDLAGEAFPPPPPGPISFERVSYSMPDDPPTAMVWGPDNRLYVASVSGRIHRFAYNTATGQLTNTTGSPIGTIATNYPGQRLILGLALDPASTSSNVILWAVHSRGFGVSSDPGIANSGVLTRLSGTNLGIRVDYIEGLPRSRGDHAPNSIHFGPDGWLYMAIGGNTGAGAPVNDTSDFFGPRPEQPLSATIIKANVRRPDWSLEGDGQCETSINEATGHAIPGIPNSCDVEWHATGLRNPYDFVFHPNGRMYSTDNGLGIFGVAPEINTPTSSCQGFSDDPKPDPQPDKIHLIEEGKYYGHPNPSRGECVFFTGAEQGINPSAWIPGEDWQPALHYPSAGGRSANGIIAYNGKQAGACAALDGDILTTYFAGVQYIGRFRPTSSGTSIGPEMNLASGFSKPLTLTQGPQGAIFVGEFGPQDGSGTGAKVTALIPKTGC